MYPFSNNKVPQIKELGSNGAGMPLTSSVSLDTPLLLSLTITYFFTLLMKVFR